ncbi:prolyl-tRNA synthetase [Podila humilis]|nr:prolyl-tRNA synthetase [Podila humilis]
MVPSQQLLLRAGMMRQSSSGIYTIMPFGQRVMDKIEGIIDDELELIGCQKLSMPNLLSSENWKITGRWESTGQEMFKVKDRKGADFLLAPTHEEEVTALIAKDVKSYRQLPVRVYQVGRKYRDELRARSGLLRGKEFLMKDLYTFDVSAEEALKTYDEVVAAYRRILSRIGVPFAVAEADTGNIGGTHSHEFHILSKVGEDSVLSCKSCGYTSNEERAVGIIPSTPTKASTKFKNTAVVPKWIESLDLVPRSSTVRINPKLVFGILKKDKTPSTKSNKSSSPEKEKEVEENTYTMVAVATTGDRVVNDIKLTKAIGPVQLVDSLEEIRSSIGEQGKVDDFLLCVDQSLYPGQSGLDRPSKTIEIHGDGHGQSPLPDEVTSLMVHNNTTSSSATTTSTAMLKVIYGDYHNCKPGDGCPHCFKKEHNDNVAGGRFEPMESSRAIEIGHTFLLGTKYSSSLEAKFMPADGGEPEPFQMGCYGLGISRLLASVVEASHDHKGIIWPESVAPFQVVIVTSEDEECVTKAETVVYESIQRGLNQSRKLDLILDDRTDVTLGFKMKDAELIGYPWMVVVGKGYLRTGKVEVQRRMGGEKYSLAWEELEAFFAKAQKNKQQQHEACC